MSTALAPDTGNVGGSSTPVDPIDAMDLSTIDESGVSMPDDVQIPDDMMVGGKKREPAAESEAGRERTPDGKFAKKEGEPTPEGTEAPKPLPFRYRAMNATHELEGATVDADGNTVIPAAKFEELREAFASMHQLRHEYGPANERYKAEAVQLRSALKQATESRGPREAQAQSIVDAFARLTQIQDPTERLNQLWQFADVFPRLTLEAKAKYLEDQLQQATARPAAPAPQNERQRSAMPEAPAIQHHATEQLEKWKIDPKWRDVPAEAWGQAEARIRDTPYAFMRQATAAHAKAHAANGIHEGDLVFDYDLLFAPIQQHVASTAAAEAEKKRLALAATNARSTQASITAPPSASGSTSPAPKKKGFQTQKEVDDWFNSDSLD